MRRGLVGDDVDVDAAPQQLGQHVRAVAFEPDRERPALGLGGQHALDGVVEVVGPLVEVALVHAALEARAGSTSTISTTPPFMVTASGCAPPMPPQPPVTVSVPASEPPKRFSAMAAKVS